MQREIFKDDELWKIIYEEIAWICNASVDKEDTFVIGKKAVKIKIKRVGGKIDEDC